MLKKLLFVAITVIMYAESVQATAPDITRNPLDRPRSP